MATMAYDYAQRSVWINSLEAHRDPHRYELCGPCSERMAPPRGWILTDLRARALFEVAS